ncbi:polymer-forming cytoskeletal protein [Massilia sp. CF038]|uniref:bactofilin family protein n=1 Tax=Massilia sp. CF038 TaxID=1881045 RepID=UPI00091168D0|nr:polymer-forming cytoskeletal protein [Massilia sp. CF038]SHH28568.1 protein CcmA, bactofilin family [Massilia sp. CF038]
MFGRNVKTEIDSLVGISARIEGNLCFTGGLRIDGEVHGDVIGGDTSESVLIVSEHARIEGDVHCGTLIVEGYIAGDVFATELLELQPKGRIIGNVHYKKLEMHSGATVAGTLTHQQTGEPVFHMAITQPILSKVTEAGGAARVYNE